MASAPFKSNSLRRLAVTFALALTALFAVVAQSSAADRGPVSSGDVQNVFPQAHNGLIVPTLDGKLIDQIELPIVNYNSVAVNGKVTLVLAKKIGKYKKGKIVASGGFSTPADGPTTAILLSEKPLDALWKTKIKNIPVRAKLALWTNGYAQLGKFEAGYSIVRKLKDEKKGANTLPTVANSTYTVKEDATLKVPTPGLLAAATDPDLDHLYLRVTQRPAHAKTFTIGADGLFTYVNAAKFVGTDTFTYDVFDGLGYSNTATVSITVTPKAPVIATIPDQKVNYSSNATFSLKSLVTSSVPVTAYALTGAPAGTSIDSNGVVSNTDPWASGTTTVTLKATNSAGATSKTFKLIVIPIKLGTLGNQSSSTGSAISPLDVSGGFSSGVPFTGFTATGLPSGLTISNAGVISGTPANGSETGSPYNVSVTATDANGTTPAQTFTWTITVGP
jgi:hypothetical protein